MWSLLQTYFLLRSYNFLSRNLLSVFFSFCLQNYRYLFKITVSFYRKQEFPIHVITTFIISDFWYSHHQLIHTTLFSPAENNSRNSLPWRIEGVAVARQVKSRKAVLSPYREDNDDDDITATRSNRVYVCVQYYILCYSQWTVSHLLLLLLAAVQMVAAAEKHFLLFEDEL